MTHDTQILVCIDGSPISEAVIDYGIWLAMSSQAGLTFLHTIEHSYHSQHVHREGHLTPNNQTQLLHELSDEERQESKRLMAQGKQLLNAAVHAATQAGVKTVSPQLRHGTLAEALPEMEDTYLLTVMGIQGVDHSDQKQGLGAQLEAVIRAARSPLFIVKTAFRAPESMLLAYNGSPTARKLLQPALYRPFQTLSLHIVSVDNLDIAHAQAKVAQARQALGSCFPEVLGQPLQGEARNVLIQYQQQHQVDVIAMGAFSHGKLHGFFFGSFTTRMLLDAQTNFLLVR